VTPEARILCDLDKIVGRCQISATKMRKDKPFRGDVLAIRELTQNLLENIEMMKEEA
jgi:hypothetical protein